MNAVSNTTPLRYLIAIQQEYLLGKLFEKVFVPVAVQEDVGPSGRSPMRQRILSCVVILLVAALPCVAKTPPESRVVDLTAKDGVHLKATYFAAGKPGPGVILLHQCNQQRKNWDDLAGRLAAAGINVLTLDYRGYGDSEGPRALELSNEDRTKMITEQWPGDIDTAFQYLSSQPGVTKDVMGAGGASCGVNRSIQLARRHAEVKSLVLLSGNTDRNGRKFLQTSAGLPIFFSAADDDPGAVDLMEWLYAVAPNPENQFAHYATGGHGTVMLANTKSCPERLWSGLRPR
jgi:dienelactone hydrolase